MEPRALANLAGNLVPASTEKDEKPVKDPISPTTEFLTFKTPLSRRETFIIQPQVEVADENAQSRSEVPYTPTIAFTGDDTASADAEDPATPYYLSKDARLIQRTCPPKQAGEMLFPTSGDEDNHVKRKLLEARRKSMAFASKTRSPLGRTVSYGAEKSL